MNALDLVQLSELMKHSKGRRELIVAMIDGPVAITHPALATRPIREIPANPKAACARASSIACRHGTFVAGILCAERGSTAPAICPECTLLVRPIFSEGPSGDAQIPIASPLELAVAIVECVDAGARVVNLSAALSQPSRRDEQALADALDYSARRGVIVVAASGNDGAVGGSPITRHRWVIPVTACTSRGMPMSSSNLGHSIGRRGLRAPGDRVTSLAAEGGSDTFGGTSAAAPFVTGTIALVWSDLPGASAAQVKQAVTDAHLPRHPGVVPPLLNSWAVHRFMQRTGSRGETP